jgi:hypothetical protein
MNNNNNEPYTSYKKLCTNLLEDYGKCMLEKAQTNPLLCNDKLYLIQKWCMNPVGVVHITSACIPTHNNT